MHYVISTALRRLVSSRPLGGPFTELENRALEVIRGIDEQSVVRARNMAYIIQNYEKAFWDAIYSVR